MERSSGTGTRACPRTSEKEGSTPHSAEASSRKRTDAYSAAAENGSVDHSAADHLLCSRRPPVRTVNPLHPLFGGDQPNSNARTAAKGRARPTYGARAQ